MKRIIAAFALVMAAHSVASAQAEIVVADRLEMLMGQPLTDAQRHEISRAEADVQAVMSEPRMMKMSANAANATTTVLYCVGVQGHYTVGAQAAICTDPLGQAYKALGLTAGYSVGATAEVGVLLVRVYDGEIRGNYVGGQIGLAAGFVGGGGGAYVKLRHDDAPASKKNNNVMLRLRYTVGLSVEATVAGIGLSYF